MKISDNTVAVLKSFTTINPSIFVKEGNVLRTISPQKTIMAFAEVEEVFPRDFAIYDLIQFLSVLSLFDDPELEFKKDHVLVSQGSSKVKYVYADESTIVKAPDKDLELPDTVVEFDLTKDTLEKTLKASTALRAPNWVVKGDGESVYISVYDWQTSSSNSYEKKVGETDKKFDLVFKVDNLKFMRNDYKVIISSKGISRFSAAKGALTYFVATETR